MDTQTVTISIPRGLELPAFMHEFSKEENLYMILVGSYATYTLKNGDIGYQKDADEHKALRMEFEEIIKMKDVAAIAIKKTFEELIEKEQEKRFDKINEQLDKEKAKMNKELKNYQDRIETLQCRLNAVEKDNVKKDEFISHSSRELDHEVAFKMKQKEMEMMRSADKYRDTMLRNKEHESEKMSVLQREMADMRLSMSAMLIENEKEKNAVMNESMKEMTRILQDSKTQNKTNVRGKEGESYFLELATATFGEYDNFDIVDKSKVSHSGDFHLIFSRFTIMVDSKCFIDTDVPSKDRKKLKYDITQNRHIKIAWMVSMHRPILKYSKYPFMMDIEDGICYCYINSLMESENPGNLLKMAWHASNIVYDLLNCDDDALLLGNYKKNDARVRTIMERMMKRSKERYATLKQLKENFDDTDRDIKDVLNDEILNIRNIHEQLVERWWRGNFKDKRHVRALLRRQQRAWHRHGHV